MPRFSSRWVPYAMSAGGYPVLRKAETTTHWELLRMVDIERGRFTETALDKMFSQHPGYIENKIERLEQVLLSVNDEDEEID